MSILPDLPPFAPTDIYTDETDYDRDEVGPAVASRPTIRVTTEMAEVVDAVQDVLRQAGGIYQRGGQLVRVIEAPAHVERIERARGTAIIGDYAAVSLQEAISRAAACEKWDERKKGWKRCLPPAWAAEALAARGSWPFPALRGLVTAPTIRTSGGVLDAPGYDAETGLMLMHSGRWPRILAHPTRDDAVKALTALLEPFVDFPFTSGSGRAGAVSAVLTLVCRTAIEGPSPLFVVGARDAGTGKTRLADVIAIIATGTTAPRITPWAEPEEARKLFHSLAMAGDPHGLIDNWPANQGIGDAALDNTLTSTSVQGRVLGTSTMAAAPWSAVLIVTGNNISYNGDTARRVIPIDLDAGMENPEERTAFLHSPLEPWVAEHRKRLVVAAITIMRAWHVAGKPAVKCRPFASFEAWGDTVRQALLWLGMEDPCAGNQALKEQADPNREALRVMLSRWAEMWHETWRTSAQVKADLQAGEGAMIDDLTEAIEALMPDRQHGKLTSKNLGRLLTRHVGTVRGGLKIERGTKDRDGSYLWRVAQVAESPWSKAGR